MTEEQNTFAPAHLSVALVKTPVVDGRLFGVIPTEQHIEPIQVTDFYRSKPMDETLQELQQAAKDHNEQILAWCATTDV